MQSPVLEKDANSDTAAIFEIITFFDKLLKIEPLLKKIDSLEERVDALERKEKNYTQEIADLKQKVYEL